MPLLSRMIAVTITFLLPPLLSAGISAPAAPVTAPDAKLSYVAAPGDNGWLLGTIPNCNGMRTLPQPVSFDWPNFEKRKRQLAGSTWAYFTCTESADVVSKVYRDRLTKAPYNMREVNWVPRREGTLGVFQNLSSFVWLYVWVVPQPGAPQNALVVVAHTFGNNVAFKC